ncbi:MAG: fructose-bisphosphatase, class II [Parcubacteria group bacterium RIFCSPLOWO2_01_FULL_48_18]|nr:MAG: fructose-bisphosphatase, class II [Parcubacteria group bacterium RIFCSPLOWO2_01_FULL_48_18]OHB24472.1 MAG: fructose-bisphosphatase, class II [Parcubacteria group bacterium RIFCSPHIGHO2_02_FULL_48_10b]
MTNGSVFANLALEFVRVTESAAVASARWIGKGDGKAADKAAVDEMRERFNQIEFCGEVVIGEGEKDEAPELYVGEHLGCGEGGAVFDIAVDPLECTDSVAYGRPNAMAVIATGPKGTLYRAIDSYMEKISVGKGAWGAIDLDAPTADNIKKTAAALGKDVSEITVAVLDRPRHEQLIKEIRLSGARVQLFTDGDVAMAVATCLEDSPVDMLMGIGGSTEAVLAAAALKCLGGEMLCRWKPKDEKHLARLSAAGITDLKKIFTVQDLARGDHITFTATGVISGPLLQGVVFAPRTIITHSVIMSSQPKEVRFLETRHAHE